MTADLGTSSSAALVAGKRTAPAASVHEWDLEAFGRKPRARALLIFICALSLEAALGCSGAEERTTRSIQWMPEECELTGSVQLLGENGSVAASSFVDCMVYLFGYGRVVTAQLLVPGNTGFPDFPAPGWLSFSQSLDNLENISLPVGGRFDARALDKPVGEIAVVYTTPDGNIGASGTVQFGANLINSSVGTVRLEMGLDGVTFDAAGLTGLAGSVQITARKGGGDLGSGSDPGSGGIPGEGCTAPGSSRCGSLGCVNNTRCETKVYCGTSAGNLCLYPGDDIEHRVCLTEPVFCP